MNALEEEAKLKNQMKVENNIIYEAELRKNTLKRKLRSVSYDAKRMRDTIANDKAIEIEAKKLIKMYKPIAQGLKDILDFELVDGKEQEVLKIVLGVKGERGLEILRLKGSGLSNANMAIALNVSETTIKSNISEMKRKINHTLTKRRLDEFRIQ